MAFTYQPTYRLQGLQYPTQQSQSQQQQGPDIGTAMQIGSQFMGGGATAGSGISTAGASSGISTASASSGIGAGQLGGASSGTGGSSALAAAGPWAALAAIIAVNEYNAVGGGYRNEDKAKYTQDLFSGEVLGQDIEKRWLPKLGMEEGSKENKWISHLIHPVTADLGESWESFKDLF